MKRHVTPIVDMTNRGGSCIDETLNDVECDIERRPLSCASLAPGGKYSRRHRIIPSSTLSLWHAAQKNKKPIFGSFLGINRSICSLRPHSERESELSAHTFPSAAPRPWLVCYCRHHRSWLLSRVRWRSQEMSAVGNNSHHGQKLLH